MIITLKSTELQRWQRYENICIMNTFEHNYYYGPLRSVSPTTPRCDFKRWCYDVGMTDWTNEVRLVDVLEESSGWTFSKSTKVFRFKREEDMIAFALRWSDKIFYAGKIKPLEESYEGRD